MDAKQDVKDVKEVAKEAVEVVHIHVLNLVKELVKLIVRFIVEVCAKQIALGTVKMAAKRAAHSLAWLSVKV